MATSVIIEGNSIDNGIYSSGAYTYDELLNIDAPSIITNNTLSATTTTGFTITAECMVTNNTFKGTVTTFGIVSAASKISDNSFTGPAATTFLSLTANCIVDGNSFNTPSASATFITLTSCACRVTNNSFTRGATSITSYITASGSSDQAITNNYFDSTTVDGTVEDLVSGITSTSTYIANKNQTIYVPIQLASYMAKTHSSTSFPDMAFVCDTNASANANNQLLQVVVANTTSFSIQTNVNITPLVPDGVKILSIKYGCHRASGGSPVMNGGASNKFQLRANVYDTVKANFTAGTGSIMDVQTRANTTLTSVTGTYYNLSDGTSFANLNTITQYQEMDTSANVYFVNNRHYIIVCQLDIFILLTSGALTLGFSPLVVKCRW